MKAETKPPNKKGLNTPKNRQLLIDAVLVIVSLVIPHASLPISIFAIIKIVRDFHLSNREEGED